MFAFSLSGNSVMSTLRSRSISLRKLSIETLTDRSVLRIRGPDRYDYLQGLITNDIRHLTSSSKMIYAYFLNVQGRILFDAFLSQSKQDEILLDVHSEAVSSVIKHLKLYKLRRDVHIEPDPSLNARFISVPENEDLNDILAEFRCLSGSLDPRVSSLLGARVITSHHDSSIRDSRNPLNPYSYLRTTLGLSEGPFEIPLGKCFPLEYNGDYCHALSFQKGCYIGQELTARTYHTGVVRKRIVPVELSQDTVNSIPFDEILRNENGKKVGKLRSKIERGRGLALLRLEDCYEIDGICRLITFDNGIQVRFSKPDWWPKEAPKTKRPHQKR